MGTFAEPVSVGRKFHSVREKRYYQGREVALLILEQAADNDLEEEQIYWLNLASEFLKRNHVCPR